MSTTCPKCKRKKHLYEELPNGYVRVTKCPTCKGTGKTAKRGRGRPRKTPLPPPPPIEAPLQTPDPPAETICPKCNGEGFPRNKKGQIQPCGKCHGTGTVGGKSLLDINNILRWKSDEKHTIPINFLPIQKQNRRKLTF